MSLKTRIIVYLSILAALTAFAVASAGLGYKIGVFNLQAAFKVLQFGAMAAMAGAGVAFIALLVSVIPAPRAIGAVPLIALILAASAAATPFAMRHQALKAPPIHDITTDTVNPPRFVTVLEKRKEGENDTDYAGEEIAIQQREAYPDIQPLYLSLNKDAAFAVTLDAISRSGWELQAAAPVEGRIEATATTFWFGFKDDIVIRIRQEAAGRSRIDIRSASRVGMSDLGANAARIKKLVKKMEEGAS
ncbi:MAG: DUF1499 domain-containing protein [Pseudomonadota bacterium]